MGISAVTKSNETAAVRTVFAERLTAAPVWNNTAIDEAVWGEPAVILTPGAEAAGLVYASGSGTAYDGAQVRLYLRWDDACLYVAVRADDPDGHPAVSAPGETWTGDALQLFLDPEGAAASGDPAFPFSSNCRNLTFNRVTGGALELNEHSGKAGFDNTVPDPRLEKSYRYDGGRLDMMLKIPHSALGVADGDAEAGFVYGFGIAKFFSGEDCSWTAHLDWGKSGRNGSIAVVLRNGSAPVRKPDAEKIVRVSAASNANASAQAADLKPGTRLVSTARGTYAVYVNRVRHNSNNYNAAYNQFTLVSVTGRDAKKLAFQYTAEDSVDILAAGDRVHITGGASSLVQKPGPQKAVLDLWYYNEETGVLQGYHTRQFSFEGGSPFRYQTAFVRGDAVTAVFSAEEGGLSRLAWAKFDLRAGKWSAPVTAGAPVPPVGGEVYAFAAADGFALVYASGTSVQRVRVPESVRQTVFAEPLSSGTLLDAYMSASGELYTLISRCGGIGLYRDGAFLSVLPGGGADRYAKMTELGGSAYIVTMKRGTGASYQLFRDGVLLREEQLSARIVPAASHEITDRATGSTRTGAITVMFPAERGSLGWYAFEIAPD